MIVINIRVPVNPAKRSEFVAAAQQETRFASSMAGCVKYGWAQDIGNPDQFVLYEEWESQARFDGYKNSDHFQQLNQTLAPMLSGAPQSSTYQTAALETA